MGDTNRTRRISPKPDPRQGAVSLGPLQNYIAFQLRRAQEISFAAFSARVGQANLAPGHFAMLAVIGANRGISQAALSRATGRDKSTLTPAIRALLRRKLIARARSKSDSRAYRLSLTAAGKRYLDKLRIHAEAHDRLLDHIVGNVHKTLLIELLDQIASGLQQATDESLRRGRVG